MRATKMNHLFYKLWLISGIVQLFQGSIALSSPFPSDFLFSEKPKQVDTSATMPVRISRLVFERKLKGTLIVDSEDLGIHLNRESTLSWTEMPTQLPPPSRPAEADFRNFMGCLRWESLNGVAVCFDIMPDVASVGVNSQEMQLQGIENFMNGELENELSLAPCSVSLSGIQLIKAVKEKNRVALYLSGTVSPLQSGCDTNVQPIDIQLVLTTT